MKNYTKEEVETFLFNLAEHYGMLSSKDDINDFNEWIEENLNDLKSNLYVLGDDTINGEKISDNIFDGELFEYRIIYLPDFKEELMRWISECKNPGEKQMMIDDLEMLMQVDDEYIFSSMSTNEYITSSDSEFDSTCEELLKLNREL